MMWSRSKSIGVIVIASLAAISAIAGFGLATATEPDSHPADIVNGVLGGSTEFQRAFADDGVLTRSEYESAADAMFTCFRNAGLELKDVTTGQQAGEPIRWQVFVPQSLGAGGTAAMDDCDRKYFQDVRAAWNMLTELEEVGE